MQEFSIIIPVYNEEKILSQTVAAIHTKVAQLGYGAFEIILIENGSSDDTLNLCKRLKRRYQQVIVKSLPSPSMGKAIRIGVQTAFYPTVVLFNADWWDIEFIKQAIPLLSTIHIVVGSKALTPNSDKRPKIRKIGSFLLTQVLHILFQFQGSDSHGLKVFRKKETQNILRECISNEIIESEMLIRAQKKGLQIKEIPVPIKEIRPARLSFLYRCFTVSKELFILYIGLKKV